MIRRSSALAADVVMCGLINLLQSRHRLDRHSRAEMERYVASCENLTIQDYYRPIDEADLSQRIADNGLVSWLSPLKTNFPANDTARVELFPTARGWSAPTVLMLHALMSATRIGYRRWAAHFNRMG